MSIEFYQRLAADLVRDDANRITPEQVDTAIGQAAARLSRELPRERLVQSAGVSGQVLDTPAGWVVGLSRVIDIEYPVGSVPRELLDAQRVTLLDQVDGTQKIGLTDALPAASTVRIKYSAPHAIDDQQDTVPDHLRWGVACMAASILCGQLASAYANQTDSTISADAVEHKSKSELYQARERQYWQQAFISWGLPVPSASNSGAASASAGDAAGTVVSFGSRRGSRVERGLRLS